MSVSVRWSSVRMTTTSGLVRVSCSDADGLRVVRAGERQRGEHRDGRSEQHDPAQPDRRRPDGERNALVSRPRRVRTVLAR